MAHCRLRCSFFCACSSVKYRRIVPSGSTYPFCRDTLALSSRRAYNSIPFQTDCFTPAQTVECAKQNRQLKFASLSGFKESVDLIGIIKAADITILLRTLNLICRVYINQVNLHGILESLVNVGMITEIEVFEVRLNEPLLDAAVLKQIDKEIPYHLLFILTCDGKAQEWIGYILQNAIVDAYVQCGIETIYHEYYELISTTPDISQEDYLYIQEIVSNSMSKRLSVERDENRRLRIRLSNQEFLGVPRDELPLSTGEQNFLSLTFEFLKAKNSAAPIVVIDDPVSSFDSIYKNKVVYAIVKILHHKKRIVLTHNTDLIRLLDGQHKHCFKLYLLNNTDGEVNGFIPLRNREQDMLISLEKLLDAFRTDVPRKVQNVELYLISMIPFMRGYANIANKKDIFEALIEAHIQDIYGVEVSDTTVSRITDMIMLLMSTA